MRSRLQLIAAAVCCVGAGAAEDSRFNLPVGDPSGLARPKGACRGADSASIEGERPAVPYQRATTIDGCRRERAFRKGDGVRSEAWELRSGGDGGLQAVNTWVSESHLGWVAEGGDPGGSGVIAQVRVTEWSDAGQVLRQISQSSQRDGTLLRQTSTPDDAGQVDVREESFLDGGWVQTSQYQHAQKHPVHTVIKPLK